MPQSLAFSTKATPSDSQGVTVDVANYAIHCDLEFRQERLFNDYALVELSEPVSIATYGIPGIANPFANQTGPFPLNHYHATAVGYGKDNSNTPGRKLTGTIVYSESNSDATHLHFNRGPDGQMTCVGDSGGPVIKNNIIIGVLSTGTPVSDCNRETFAVYASVPFAYNWIQSTQALLSNDSENSPWQNPVARFDTNNDGFISPLDVLIVINYLNRFGSGSLADRNTPLPPETGFVDVSGDGLVTPLDALHIINALNRGEGGPVIKSAPAPVFTVDAAKAIAEYQKPNHGVFDKLYQKVAYDADQTLGFRLLASTYTNWGGRNEKWVYSNRGWHFILPNGNVYKYTGFISKKVNGTIVASLTSEFHKDLSLLTNPTEPDLGPSDEQQPSEHKIFVTSEVYRGDLGGLSGADRECARLAGESGWKAVLSDASTEARSRIRVNGPVYDTRGNLIANNASDFWDGSVPMQVNKDQNGNTVNWRNSLVWTGTNSDGTRSGQTCNNWTSASGAAQAGRIDRTNQGWLGIYTGYASHSCSNLSRIYCFK